MVWSWVMVLALRKRSAASSSESYQEAPHLPIDLARRGQGRHRGSAPTLPCPGSHPVLSSPRVPEMLRRILDQQQDVLLAEERRLLGERAVRQLDELFLLVVAGEFNAGKSAFINALLGSRVLEEGVTPTTTRVQIVKHGATVGRTTTEAALDVVTAPVDLLAEINIVDT